MSKVSQVCGSRCIFQRFRFTDGVVLSNGYSAVKYPNDLTSIDLAQMEATWNGNENLDRFALSFGPLRSKMPEKEKVSFLHARTAVTENGVLQTYIKKGLADFKTMASGIATPKTVDSTGAVTVADASADTNAIAATNTAATDAAVAARAVSPDSASGGGGGVAVGATGATSRAIRIFVRVRPPRDRRRATAGRYYCYNPGQAATAAAAEAAPDGEQARIGFRVPRDEVQGLVNHQRENYDYAFDRVFDGDASQEEVFDAVAKDVVLSALMGYNGTIFAYGQTGSGKTFTITGGGEKYADRGLIPRTLQYIFHEAKKRPSDRVEVAISYLEIYNEAGYDLLDTTRDAKKLEDLPKVRIQEDENQNIHIQGLSLTPAVNEEEALNLLFVGDTNRMIAETPSNPASSRSHCIFIVSLTSKRDGEDRVRRSKLHLVDLAGSERASRTGITGNLFKEASYINLSLHYLEQVIVALHEKAQGRRTHVPYRNSMMTSVLRDSLGGNCMTTMIATVAPEDDLIE
ncbi:Kinesin- protein 6, partial [Cladochytrium tenue]